MSSVAGERERLCPTCGLMLDPLRAPIARISGGKVLAFCSPACARGEPAKAAPAVVVPAAAVPVAVLPAVVVHVERQPVPEPAPTHRVAARAAETTEPVAILLASSATPPDRTRRLARVAALVGAISAIGAVVAIVPTLTSPSRPSVASASSVEEPVSAQPAAAPPPAAAVPEDPDRAAVLPARARELLARYLADTSPRIRLLAAMALSRTGDRGALDELARALKEDPSAIRRLDVAYALARASDERGTAALVAALTGQRRDVRLQAARYLASMKDERAKGPLRYAMKIPSLRLSAAETLAGMGDEEAKQVLREALRSNMPEHRMRGAVGLARAGDDSGLALLEELVATGRVELGAAEALARLGRKEAIPALEQALRHSALRVEGAIALRRLGAAVNPKPLAAALAAGDEVGRISAAEAILVLLDPAPPAEIR